jgi:hypothetical protein
MKGACFQPLSLASEEQLGFKPLLSNSSLYRYTVDEDDSTPEPLFLSSSHLHTHTPFQKHTRPPPLPPTKQTTGKY